jgi:hypothetical protein
LVIFVCHPYKGLHFYSISSTIVLALICSADLGLMLYWFIKMRMDNVSESRSAWQGWAEFLHRHGLENLVAWMLEAAGPLTLLGAQALYLGGPLLRPALTDQERDALASLLEDRIETRAFTAFLREEISL